MRKFWVIILAALLIGCGLNTTRNITPIPGPDIALLARTKGLAANKDDISVVVVPMQSVKELDAFGVMIINESSNWVSIKKEDCILIQGGEAKYPLDDKQVTSRMGSSYKPSVPEGLVVDISDWRRSVNYLNSRDLEIVDENKKVSVMGGTKETIFLHYKTSDNLSPMQLIISNIYNETTKQRTRFSFSFNVEKK